VRHASCKNCYERNLRDGDFNLKDGECPAVSRVKNLNTRKLQRLHAGSTFRSSGKAEPAAKLRQLADISVSINRERFFFRRNRRLIRASNTCSINLARTSARRVPSRRHLAETSRLTPRSLAYRNARCNLSEKEFASRPPKKVRRLAILARREGGERFINHSARNYAHPENRTCDSGARVVPSASAGRARDGRCVFAGIVRSAITRCIVYARVDVIYRAGRGRTARRGASKLSRRVRT